MLSLLSARLLTGETIPYDFDLGGTRVRVWVDEKRLALSLVVLCTSLSWRAMLVLNTSLFLDDLGRIRSLSDPWILVGSLELSRGVLFLIHLAGCFLFLPLFLYAALLHAVSFLALNHRQDVIDGAARCRRLVAEKIAALRPKKTD